MAVVSTAVMLAVQGISSLLGVAGSRAIKRRKNVKQNLIGVIFSFVFNLLFPIAGLAINLARPKRPPQGRSPEETEVFKKRFDISEKKRELEKKNARVDKLLLFKERSFGYKMSHPGQWFPEVRIRNNDMDIADLKSDIRSEYELLGRAQRRAEMSGSDRFVAIRMDLSMVDGKPRFGIPYDIAEDQKNEIKYLISQKYGISPNDDFRFYQSDHRSADMGGYGVLQSVLVFDSMAKIVNPLGKDMSSELSEKISKVMSNQEDTLQRLGLVDRDGFTIHDNLITLDPIGKDAVALNMNGVTLAYAVAGEDGKVRSMGHSVTPGDTGGLKLASALNEQLKQWGMMEQWIEAASKIVMSGDNFESVRLGINEKRTVKRKLDEKRAVRLKILNAPAKSFSKIMGGIKM